MIIFIVVQKVTHVILNVKWMEYGIWMTIATIKRKTALKIFTFSKLFPTISNFPISIGVMLQLIEVIYLSKSYFDFSEISLFKIISIETKQIYWTTWWDCWNTVETRRGLFILNLTLTLTTSPLTHSISLRSWRWNLDHDS